MGSPTESVKESSTDKLIKPIQSLRLRRQAQSFTYERLHRSRQLQKLLGACLTRWAITLALCASIYLILWQYSSKTAMVTSKKKEFNTLIVGLSILLSLNLASSLKHMVATLRWWVLNLQEWKPREVDLILQSENISRMVRLMYVSRRYSLRAYVIIWVSINVAAQIGLATIGLVYNVNGADKIVPTRPGVVSVPDLSTIQTLKLVGNNGTTSKSQIENALRYTANSYGMVGLAAGVISGPSNIVNPPQPGSIFNPDSYPITCVNTACYSWFYESTPANVSYYLMAASNRSVSTLATCQSWQVTKGGSGNMDSITVADSKNTTYKVPTKNGPLQTTFVVDPLHDRHVGWSIVYALEASNVDPWYYKCNVSIGPVVNAVIPEHQLGETLKLMAPAAIALQGYGSSPLGTNTSDRIQFQSYPAETFVGSPCNGNTTAMGYTTSAFAAGVILATAQSNSNLNATGQMPLKGITLDINNWVYVHLVLCLIMGLQLVFAAISIILSNTVMVRDHSHFGEATLLRSVMCDLSYRAVMCNERELASLFPETTTLRYVPDTNGVYYLRVTQ
ncbi:hypothetical protein QQS21_008407 [Conoideocrella luteorostrata]|uniref:Uncharacterized protein n=1 Tax=Conoideocrella luteorostrata TaxID=1105319 RepID=A0AAJ0CLP3_9HYPO|nr:hypothetical protein QQS21_008407 [Conoideocrella luteorostrata]